jgi:hypothetical protein
MFFVFFRQFILFTGQGKRDSELLHNNECPNLISSYLILSRFATASQSWLHLSRKKKEELLAEFL